MLRTILRGLWARKRRLLGTATAVVLGVAFLTATLVLGDTMRAGFADAFTEANAGTDVLVRSAAEIDTEDSVRDFIDAELVDTVAGVDGVARAVPSIEGLGTLVDASGDRLGGDGPPTVATNWIDDPELNPYRLAEGRAPARDGEVVINRGAADDGDLHIGDRTTVLTPAPVEVTIVGIATFGDDDSLGNVTYTAFTLPEAQRLIAGRPDAISSVLVAAEDRVSQESLRDEIMQLMPARIEALTQAELTAEQEADVRDDFLGVFEVLLIAFAGIAMVVAAFSIYNTFSIVIAQRTRESALLRAVGASRRQVLAGVGVEALLVGVLASVAGFVAGIGLAAGLDALLAGLNLPDAGLVVGTDTIVTAGAVGVLTTLVASLAPAVKASRVTPLAAMRDIAVDRSAVSKTRVVTGLVTAAGGLALVIAASTEDGAISRVGLGAIAVLVGAVVLGPVVARPAAAVLGAGPAATRGFAGRLARRNAMRNPRRIAASASALMVGTGVVALFTTFGASLEATIDDAVDTSFSGDLVVVQNEFSGAAISPELAGAIATLPEVAGAVGVGEAPVLVDGHSTEVFATDLPALDSVLDLGFSEGSVAGFGPGQIAISEHYADEHELAAGDPLPVTFVDGATADLTVGAVFTERMSFGDLLIDRDDWTAHAGQAGDVVVFVDLAEGVAEADGKAAVTDVTDRFLAPEPQTRDGYVDSVGDEIDQMLTLVYGLLAVAVLIGLMGVGNTLALSIHERTQELGLLRAVGQSRRQVRSTVRWESVIVAVFGTIGGVAVGTFLGWGVMRAIEAQEGFGVFAVPTTSLAVILALAAVAGVVAALRPARRAAKLDILQAVAAE
jgi:putative ABC transport system permease protein